MVNYFILFFPSFRHRPRQFWGTNEKSREINKNLRVFQGFFYNVFLEKDRKRKTWKKQRTRKAKTARKKQKEGKGTDKARKKEKRTKIEKQNKP